MPSAPRPNTIAEVLSWLRAAATWIWGRPISCAAVVAVTSAIAAGVAWKHPPPPTALAVLATPVGSGAWENRSHLVVHHGGEAMSRAVQSGLASLKGIGVERWHRSVKLADETSVTALLFHAQVEFRLEGPRPAPLAEEASAVLAHAAALLDQTCRAEVHAAHARQLAAIEQRLAALAAADDEPSRIARDEWTRARERVEFDRNTTWLRVETYPDQTRPTRTANLGAYAGARPPAWFVLLMGPLAGALLVTLAALGATGPGRPPSDNP